MTKYILICGDCRKEINTCSDCGYEFSWNDKLVCDTSRLGLSHFCGDCYAGTIAVLIKDVETEGEE